VKTLTTLTWTRSTSWTKNTHLNIKKATAKRTLKLPWIKLIKEKIINEKKDKAEIKKPLFFLMKDFGFVIFKMIKLIIKTLNINI
jgi:hypothetical protein